MKILITGGCGFKGTVLIEKLLEDGHEILNIDNRWFGNYLDEHLTETWYQEVPLYSNRLKVAGKVDLIGTLDGVPTVIDFKTSRKKKKKESTRQRQKRRAMELKAAKEAKQVRPEMIIVPEDNLTVQELADKLSLESSEIIKSLFFKGITLSLIHI